MDHSALWGRKRHKLARESLFFIDETPLMSVCECVRAHARSHLLRWLELGRGSGEEEVQQGAVRDQLTHSRTAGNQLAGLKQQRPGTTPSSNVVHWQYGAKAALVGAAERCFIFFNLVKKNPVSPKYHPLLELNSWYGSIINNEWVTLNWICTF